MANHKRRRKTVRAQIKSGGYVVKGITHRHWWDRFDRDMNSSREQLRRDTRREINEALA